MGLFGGLYGGGYCYGVAGVGEKEGVGEVNGGIRRRHTVY